MQAQSEIRCVHCGRGIIAANYLIHEARCLIMSSRVGPGPEAPGSRINEREGIRRSQVGGEKRLAEDRQMREGSRVQPNPSRMRNQEEKIPAPEIKFNYFSGGRPLGPAIPDPSSVRDPRRTRERIFANQPIPPNQHNQPEEERIPCSFCGYKQTLLQLDTHPNQCEHRTEQCDYCHSNFPKSLMGDHLQVCPQSPNYSHIHEEPEWLGDEDEEDSDYYGNFPDLLLPRRRSSRRREPFYDEPEEEGPTMIYESDGRGGYIQRIIYNSNPHPQRRPPSMFHQDMQSNPFFNFFNLINFMAMRNSHQQVGLTKQEIRMLKRIKYRKREDGEKDLCTICYCEFEEAEKVMELKCKHLYHEECIVKWLEKNAKCPVCKQSQTNRVIEAEE